MSASNYARAGIASTRNTLNTIAAARDNAPRYDEIQNEGMKARAEVKIAGLKAKGEIARAKIKAEADIRKTKQQLRGEEAIREGKRGVAKAGVIAAAGELLGDAFKKPGPDPMKPFQTDYSQIDQLLEETGTKLQSDIQELQGQLEGLKSGSYTPWKDGGASSSTTGGGSSSGSSGSAPSGIRGEVYTYLTNDKGLSRNHALGLMANIDRESGFNPSIRSGDDGGPGGLFQWKGGRQTSTVASLVDAGDWKGQIDYALSEPENLSAVKPGSFQATNFDTPQAAADWWMTYWERPADTASGSKKHGQFLSSYSF